MVIAIAASLEGVDGNISIEGSHSIIRLVIVLLLLGNIGSLVY